MVEERHKIREDLMKRWFAVAISVGFATTLVQMSWLNQGVLPTYEEWQQLARLAVALTAVVLSWEGYFFSISSKPLKDTPRFIIDFFLVLTYMVLLYTSKIPTFWLYLHAISFALYFSWDILSIRQYRGKYIYGDMSAELSNVKIYWGGFTNQPGIYRGPVITLSWLIYFALLAAAQPLVGVSNAFLLAPFAFFGIVLYRHDKIMASLDVRFKRRAPLVALPDVVRRRSYNQVHHAVRERAHES
jgi:hypothetical protein